MVANRHGKEKSDKETQSPMQKIFRELMEREIRDPEKESLLRERIEERRKKCNQARVKSIPRSYDSSGSDRKAVEKQYNVEMTRRRNEYVGQMLAAEQGGPLSEVTEKDGKFTSNSEGMNYKKESWCFWKEAQNQKKSEETCSCYSCVLKKYVFSHYTSIICLILLFIFTLVIAFLVLMKSTSISMFGYERVCDKAKVDSTISDSDHFRRRLEAINRKSDGHKDRIDNGVNSYASNRKVWDESEAGDIAAVNTYGNSPYVLQDTKKFNDHNTDDFTNLLRDSKVNIETGNENMKNFYKKFFQTEAIIRNLKNFKGSSHYRFDNMNRGKRSLKPDHREKSKRNVKLERLKKRYVIPNPNTMQNLIMKDNNTNLTNSTVMKINNVSNILSDTPSSFLIEKKKFVIQFDKSDPIRKSNIIPKCSHSPKEFKYHEKEMTHPFYKNTQRLDELLDKMLDLNLPVANDPIAIDLLLNNDKSQCKHLNTSITMEPSDYMKKKANIGFDEIDDIFDIENTFKTKIQSPDKSNYEPKEQYVFKNYKPYDNEAFTENIAKEALPTSSPGSNFARQKAIYDDYYSNSKTPIHYFGLRKLLQSSDGDNYQFDSYIEEEKEEKVDYDDDVKNVAKRSVLSSGVKKSTGLDDINEKLTYTEFKKTNTQPEVSHNPNWKGPMPLYPDEINTIIRHAAIQNVFNAMGTKPKTEEEVLINIKDNPSKIDSDANDIGDTEYIEDYLNTRLDKYVKMAQAYSDYGVLDEKKEATQKQQEMTESKNSDDRAGVSFIESNQKHQKDSVNYERYKKGLNEDANANGTGIETKSTDNNLPLTKSDENMIQISGNSKTFVSNLEEDKAFGNNFPFNFKFNDKSPDDFTTQETNEGDNEPNFMFGGKKRSLQDIAKDKYKLGDGDSKLQPYADSGIKMQNSRNLQLENNNANIDFDQLGSQIYKSRSLLSVEPDRSILKNNNITLVTSAVHENGSRICNSTLIHDIISNKINSTNIDAENKTVVKRAIRNENLVFWNDLYDDEYGVNLDPFSDDLIKRIKLASKPKEDKARSWFKSKFDKIKKIVHGKSRNHSKSYMKPKKPQRYRRHGDEFADNQNYKEGNFQKTSAQPVDFQVLYSKMKNIFKDAATAVVTEKRQESTEPNTDEALSHHLMQQLVKMLNDLIDYQVQLKTCRKLPQDLQVFLAWLTESKDGHVTPSTYLIEEPEDFSAIKYNIQNDDNLEDNANVDMNSEHYKSINALQELMQQYNMLSEDEKLKMPGMKEYIENQIDSIQRNVLAEENMNTEVDYLSGRFKRDSARSPITKPKVGERLKRRLGRFFKTFNKKHTKSTSTSFDIMQVSTEMVAKEKKSSNKT